MHRAVHAVPADGSNRPTPSRWIGQVHARNYQNSAEGRMNSPLITIIIPTTATKARSATLARAIASIRDQHIAFRILAVVNGPGRDKEVVSVLTQADDIDLLELAEGNLVKALTAGVAAARTKYFCVLDDDDALRPEACGKRLHYMEIHSDADVLVTPGQRCDSQGRVDRVPARFDAADPLASLFDCNWLTSCGGIYRRSRVSPEYFASMPRYLEWTYLAFRLIRERSVHFCMNDPESHFTIFETHGSESQTLEYVSAMPDNIARMRDQSLPSAIQRLLAQKLARALHEAATRYADAGRLKDAWRYHFRSLREHHGVRYLPFTRHLIAAGMRRRQLKDSR